MSDRDLRTQELLIAIREHALLYIAAEEIGDMQAAQFHDETARLLRDELVQILTEEYQLNAHEPENHN